MLLGSGQQVSTNAGEKDKERGGLKVQAEEGERHASGCQACKLKQTMSYHRNATDAVEPLSLLTTHRGMNVSQTGTMVDRSQCGQIPLLTVIVRIDLTLKQRERERKKVSLKPDRSVLCGR